MATTKTLTPTNQTITMAAFQGEKPDQRQIADAEGKLADAINALNSQLFTNKADTTLIDLVKTFNVGTYNFRLDNATDAPISSGGVVYKVVKTHGTNDTRCVITAMPMAANSPVYSAYVGQNATSITWTQLALASELDDRIPPKLKIARNPNNATSFEFDIEKSSNSYTYFLLVGGWESTSVFLYLGFISTANAVTLNKMAGSTVPGIAGTYNGSKLTITVTNTTYGGMRLIWLS